MLMPPGSLFAPPPLLAVCRCLSLTCLRFARELMQAVLGARIGEIDAWYPMAFSGGDCTVALQRSLPAC